MSVLMTGKQFKEFWLDERFWPMDSYVDNDVIFVDGEPLEELDFYDEQLMSDAANVVVVEGVVTLRNDEVVSLVDLAIKYLSRYHWNNKSITITGSQFRDFWTSKVGMDMYAWVDNAYVYVNGVEIDGYEPEDFKDTDKITVSGGTLKHKHRPSISLVNAISSYIQD